MIKTSFLLGLWILIPGVLIAQQHQFGDVSLNELEMKVYDKDTAARAVVLFDVCSHKIESSRGCTYTRHTRIKILKKEGLEEANIHLRGERGNLSRIKGATYNLENGKVVKTVLADTLVLRTKLNKWYEEKTFALLNAKVGSVIEYSYTRHYDDYTFPIWNFQYDIPSMYSELKVNSYWTTYKTHVRGELTQLKHTEEKNGKLRVWSMADIPAFVAEPLMPDEGIYRAGIDFLLQQTWLDYYANLLKYRFFGAVVFDKSFEKSQDPLPEEMKYLSAIKDDETKLKAIVGLVKRTVEWNKVYDFYADPLKEVVSKKKGSSGDINLLLANLLHRAGFKIKLVLISTRDHGFVLKDVPSLDQFNYVVCQVSLPDNKEVFIDATEKLLPYNLMPAYCYNYIGFAITPEEASWSKIDPAKEKSFATGNFVLNSDGVLSGTLSLSSFEYAAFKARDYKTRVTEEEFNKRLFNESVWSVKKLKTEGLEDPEKPLVEELEISTSDYVTMTGEAIYFSPVIFFRRNENPFKSEQRRYPISFELPVEETSSVSITIPENYTIVEVPKNLIIGLPNNDAKFIFNIAVTGNKIQVTSKMLLNETLFMPEEYAALKQFFERVVSKHAEQIVLKKVK